MLGVVVLVHGFILAFGGSSAGVVLAYLTRGQGCSLFLLLPFLPGVARIPVG